MDDFESDLEHQLSSLGRVPLAEPVEVGELRRRARRVRVGRALTGAVAMTTAVVVIVAAVVVSRGGSSATDSRKLQVAAPDFVLGDIDAVVLSSGFDADGARKPLPTSLAAAVGRVPGVKRVSGVLDTFAPLFNADGMRVSQSGTMDSTPPRTPILFSYHEGDEVHLTSGRLPVATDEIAVDAEVLSRDQVALGDSVSFEIREQSVGFKIVGVFDIPGIDLTGIPLAAVSAAHQPQNLAVDRVDVKFVPGANVAAVRAAVAAAVGNEYTVVPPSAISFPDQRLAQIEIQHAYWALLSPDEKERKNSGVANDEQEAKNYKKYADLARSVELRVENVNFLSPDAASLTYRIYYGGSPSPIVGEPQTGTATRVDGVWKLGLSTLCSLAALVGIKCDGAEHVTIAPPNGWQPPATLEPEVLAAFRALADPNATVEQRVAAVDGGRADRAQIEAGVRADAAHAGKVDLTIAGWRTVDAKSIDILYALQTTGGGGPSTPYPTIAQAEKGADGHWHAAKQYACGITGLAGGGCTISEPLTGQQRVQEGDVTVSTAATSP